MPITRLPLTGATLAQPIDFTRPGLPSLDAVHSAVAITPVPGGPTYQVLRTTEFDTYESSPQTAAIAQLLQQGAPSPEALASALQVAPAALSDNFAGTAREAAKLSISSKATEQFVDVRALIATLTADDAMIHHVPVIGTSSTSKRVAEEQRNVRVVGFLYAASREADNDFHLIVGRDPAALPEMYMTMEVSGLPPARSATFKRLKAARTSFMSFFGAHAPLLTYDFYHPPIPVVLEGSLFFDMTHAVGQHPGPPSLKSRMPTIWEVHPVTAITLGSRPGLPALESITGVEKFVSPQNDEYLILKTTETDAYDQPAKPNTPRRPRKN
jgi:hypothetical protein